MTSSLLVLIEDLGKDRCYFLEGLEDRRIKMSRHGPTVTLGYNLKGLLVIKGMFVGSLTPQGVILVDEYGDPALKGYFFSSNSTLSHYPSLCRLYAESMDACPCRCLTFICRKTSS